MSDARLPAHLEVAALIRMAETAGGFAVVAHRGERDAGTILLLTTERGQNPRLWERMPDLAGTRRFSPLAPSSNGESAIVDYLARRCARDADLWVVELDVATPERFIAELGT